MARKVDYKNITKVVKGSVSVFYRNNWPNLNNNCSNNNKVSLCPKIFFILRPGTTRKHDELKWNTNWFRIFTTKCVVNHCGFGWCGKLEKFEPAMWFFFHCSGLLTVGKLAWVEETVGEVNRVEWEDIRSILIRSRLVDSTSRDYLYTNNLT